ALVEWKIIIETIGKLHRPRLPLFRRHHPPVQRSSPIHRERIHQGAYGCRNRGGELDPLVKEGVLPAREQSIDRRDHSRRAPPVLPQRVATLRVRRGMEIGEEVRTAESEDRLLRVADEEQRTASERDGED